MDTLTLALALSYIKKNGIGSSFKTSVESDRTILDREGEEKTIYFIPKDTLNPKNGYDEYIYINGSWKLVGSTEIDLSGYTARLNTVEQELGNKLDDKNDVIKTNHIQNGAVTIDKLSNGYKQSIQNSLDNKVPLTDKIARIEPSASLVIGLDGVTHKRYPELDTANKVLTIPKAMMLIMRNGQNINLAPSGAVTVNYSNVSGSSIKVLYNLNTNTFNAVGADYAAGSNEVLICTIRDSSSFGFADHGMSISVPYIIDGKLFGENLADYIPNDSITESKLSTAYKQSVQNSVNGLATSFQNVVNGLSTNINAVKKMSLTNLIKGVTFTFGSVANSTGTETAANNRICSGFIGVSDVRFLDCSITAGYKYAITCYDSQKAFAAGTAGSLYWVPLNYQTDECVIPLHPAIKYIRITLSDTSNSNNITLNDSSKVKVLADYSQYRQFKYLNDYCGKLQESQISHDIWVNGATEGSTFVDGSTRIFSGLIECPKSGTIKIRTATGYQFWCSVFDENWTRVSTSTSWETNSNVEIGNNYKWFVITIRTPNNDNISPNSASSCTISYVPDPQYIENGAITVEKLAPSVQSTINEKADLTNKVFKMEHLGVLFPSIQNGLPNVDTENNTLTLHKDTSLLLISTSGSSQTKVLAPDGDVVIDYSSITSSAIKIYYNLSDDNFNVLAYNGVPGVQDILICTIRDTSSFGTSNHGMSISCPYTVDGKLFGVNISDFIANNSITESKLATAYKQSIQTSLNGKISTSDKIAKIEPLASLVTALDGATHGRFPELDTSNKILKFYKSTLLVMRNGQNIDLAPSGTVSISYSDISSSAIKIYYNLTSNSFSAKTASYSSDTNDVLICTIRDETGFGFTEHGMSISCPYIIDGKLFGVSLVDYIPNGSITESKLATAYKQGVQDSIDEISFYASGISSNVNSLKRLSLINLIKSATFEKGTLNNGVEAVSTTRIRSAFINISDVRSLQVSANSGYKYSLHFYDSNGTFVSSSFGNIYWHWVDWQTESYFIPILPAVKYVRIVISDTSNSEDITLNDSSKIKVLVDYSEYRQFQFLNNFCGKLQESIVPHNNWVNAATDGGSGLDYSSTRICSGLIELPKSGTIKISTATGYKANYVVFDENMTRIKATEYSTSCTAEIGNNYKWIVIFVKADSGSNVDISPNAGSNCTISYIPTDNVQCIQNIATSAATNAITNAENIQHIDNIAANSTVDISWEYGILWQNAEGDSTTRIRSGYIPVGKGTRVRCATGYQHIVFKFDLQKNWISNPNWTPNEIVVDQDCLIRITVAKSDNSVISESEINTVGNSETIIRELPQFIADNVLDFSDRIPSYYQPQLKTAIDSALNNIVTAGINGESFVFISDTHEEANAKHSPALIKEITKHINIDKIICGGDMIEGGNRTTIIKKLNDFVSAFKHAGKFYVAYGNHDGNTNGSPSEDDHLSKGETYALMQKQSDLDVQYGDLCYYYFDNPTTKTRFIVLDTGIYADLDSAQQTWFENALNNMPNGYHALIFAHIIYKSKPDVTPHIGMGASDLKRTDFMDEICTICDNFNSSSNDKTVEAIFGGHTHFDANFETDGHIPIVIIDCDARTTMSADGQGNRDAVVGTITEQCFDIVTVDYGAKKVECVRLGRGSDRTISYSEGE